MTTAYAHPDDLTDDGQGRIRIHDDGEEVDVVEYAADDDETRAWANITAALAVAGYRVTTAWADSTEDFRGPRAEVVMAVSFVRLEDLFPEAGS